MRRGDKVGGPELVGHARHGDRILECLRAVIQAVQYMAVNVDQLSILANRRQINLEL